MKKVLLVSAILLIFAGFAMADTPINWEGNTVKLNVEQGWNLVPIKLLEGMAGRYWSLQKEGITTCEYDVAHKTWMYSPVAKKYTNFVIDDWISPDSRNNAFLKNEFSSKYFHVFYGSAWIYSTKSCILAYDSVGAYPSYNMAVTASASEIEASKNYTYAELTMKAGWNFFPIDTWMASLNKSNNDILGDCQVSKVNYWDATNQKWQLSATEMTDTANRLRDPTSPSIFVQDSVFKTILIKTENDCKISVTGSSNGPPTIPQ